MKQKAKYYIAWFVRFMSLVFVPILAVVGFIGSLAAVVWGFCHCINGFIDKLYSKMIYKLTMWEAKE
ncbi:MAG: hypothetical protein LBC87_07355 [Fibromonadaceae bacterium]|jgi:nitrate reductase NapE component|nr:hypothetical protein [Fibromonadaceae bacterium]